MRESELFASIFEDVLALHDSISAQFRVEICNRRS